MSEQKLILTGPGGTLINILAQDRKTLVDFVKHANRNESDLGVFLYIERADCKCSITFSKEEDVPDKCVRCEHGNYLIYYQNDPQEDIQSSPGPSQKDIDQVVGYGRSLDEIIGEE